MLATRYIRTDFTSQADFEANYALNIPEQFNFAYDIVDEYARISPDKPAMVWTNVAGEEKRFTFRDMSEKSNQVANWFRTLGLKKGDPVMLVMKRRYEYWFCALALMKLGCIIIPATAQLAKKDVVYRCEAASVRAIVTVYLDEVCQHMEDARPECSTLEHLITLGDRDGWLNLNTGMNAQPTTFVKPDELPCNDDILIMYFTSGTTGMPKMAAHSYTYPLAQIATAAYWHNVGDDSLHIAVADTGWAKAGWVVVDTEIYSNTGGQSSKATPLGAVAQFASAGKRSRKKDLGAIFQTYGNVYVAQVAMGADPNQLIKAVKEAEEHKGPSVIIAYTPCAAHGIKAGMANVQQEMKRAVDAGYWILYRYNPNAEKPLTVDSKEPSLDYEEFLEGETRYAALKRTFPEHAETLFKAAKEDSGVRYQKYKTMEEM